MHVCLCGRMVLYTYTHTDYTIQCAARHAYIRYMCCLTFLFKGEVEKNRKVFILLMKHITPQKLHLFFVLDISNCRIYLTRFYVKKTAQEKSFSVIVARQTLSHFSTREPRSWNFFLRRRNLYRKENLLRAILSNGESGQPGLCAKDNYDKLVMRNSKLYDKSPNSLWRSLCAHTQSSASVFFSFRKTHFLLNNVY